MARRGGRAPVAGTAATVATRAARGGAVRRPGRHGLAVADGARLARRRRLSVGQLPRGGARDRVAAGYRPGASGGWRQTRGGSGRESASRGGISEGGVSGAMPGERFSSGRPALRGGPAPADAPFVAGDIADRGPLERAATPTAAEKRAREARELERQKAWRDQASRAPNALKAEEGTGPVNADELERDELDEMPLGVEEGPGGETVLVPGGSPLPTLRVLPQGISRKRLEQAVRDLQLPVVIARDVDEADVVMTLKNEYKQKTPMLRDAEDRAMPIYVLKSNTMQQMQASLTSIFSLEIDPREAAMRETEDAIEVGPHVVRGGRAGAAERLHPPAPAPDGRAGEPRVPLARPRAVSPGPALSGRGAQHLAVTGGSPSTSSAIVRGHRHRRRPHRHGPVTRARVGPLQRVVPVPRGVAVRDVDLVLISHLHWDHLDLPSLKRFAAGTPIVVPAGAGTGCARPGSRPSASWPSARRPRSAASASTGCRRTIPGSGRRAARPRRRWAS